MKNALIVYGGWDGHEPRQVSEIFERVLKEEGFNVKRSDTLDAYADPEALKALDLIVPEWTMDEIKNEYAENVSEAVASGVGLAGCHGGMCDSFRQSTLWQFMTGAQWIAHPGNDGTPYTVNVRASSSPITEGIHDFEVCSEQYYIHVDPCVGVLATTRFPNPLRKGYHSSNSSCDVPVAYTKKWGHGRVFYNSLGHVADVFDIPEALELMRRGFRYAAEGKRIAVENGLTVDEFH